VDDSLVLSTSDSARWVAVYRAWETARAQPLFHDPYAHLFAGTQGRAMADALLTRYAYNGWPLVVRTKLVDDLVQAAVVSGCDCVVNLGAGFDTRPYRLHLPSTLRWIEADLPAVIKEKQAVLRDARPQCDLRRVKVDLTSPGACAAVLKKVLRAAPDVLVLTEGLLIYLSGRQVCALSRDLMDRGVRRWILDLSSPAILADLQTALGDYLPASPMRFAPADGIGYFEALDWTVAQLYSIIPAAQRFARLPAFLQAFTLGAQPDLRELGGARWSGVVQLEAQARC